MLLEGFFPGVDMLSVFEGNDPQSILRYHQRAKKSLETKTAIGS